MQSAPISIALATFNGARHLPQQLESLALQSCLPAELIISDDGSTDGTLELIEDFSTRAPFHVKLLPAHERLGFSDNFLHAAEACRSQFIAFCDQDDSWDPHKLKLQYHAIVEERSLLCMHQLALSDEHLCATGEIWNQGITTDKTFDALQLNPYCTGWGNSMLFDQRLIRLIPRGRRPCQPEKTDRPLSHDTWVYVLAAALGRVTHLTDTLVLYRQHGSNTIGVGPTPLKLKLRGYVTAPDQRLRAEATFDLLMAELFKEVERSSLEFARSAAEAASQFYKRERICRLRLQVYESGFFGKRLSAFLRSRQMADRSLGVASMLKEVVVGVAGIHRFAQLILGRYVEPDNANQS